MSPDQRSEFERESLSSRSATMRAPRDAAAAGASDVVSARLQLTAGAHSLAHALRSVSAHSFLPSLLRPHFTWQAGRQLWLRQPSFCNGGRPSRRSTSFRRLDVPLLIRATLIHSIPYLDLSLTLSWCRATRAHVLHEVSDRLFVEYMAAWPWP